MSAITDFLPQLVLMMVGALATSVGLGQAARRGPGQRALARLNGLGFAVLAVVLVAVSAGGLYRFARSVIASAESGDFSLSTGGFLVLGLLVGLAFSLPGVVMAWQEARGGGKPKRTGPATRDDRRAFATQLASQIREAADREVDVAVRAGGDGERVLFIEGGLDSEQGNRLVAALRIEMRELGFKRVEGTGAGGEWWAPV